MLIDGVSLSTSPANHEPMQKPKIEQLNARRITCFGEIIDAGSD